ncbi:hypothetical protein [Mycoplasma nasistruthionis]|uniref:Uncharacterized protein n=1 Tax=Mycoplasma nasistruthionis TaxID=353852 RepID=A0A5B7XV96_9MOLU|nr:hypothetical protein [Mycoplasma nasistruthionis]QCZ36799.1 hypothetical protein FG904_02155 [Mycoplasma nasistruthionis]
MKKCLRCRRNFRNCRHARELGLTEVQFKELTEVQFEEMYVEQVESKKQAPVVETVVEEVVEEPIFEEVVVEEPQVQEVVEEVVEVIEEPKHDCQAETCLGKDECICKNEEACDEACTGCGEVEEVVEETPKHDCQEETCLGKEECVCPVVEEECQSCQEEVVEEQVDYLSMETREERHYDPIGGACCGGSCLANRNTNMTTRHIDEKLSKSALVREEVKECTSCKADFTLVPVADEYQTYFEGLKSRILAKQ